MTYRPDIHDQLRAVAGALLAAEDTYVVLIAGPFARELLAGNQPVVEVVSAAVEDGLLVVTMREATRRSRRGPVGLWEEPGDPPPPPAPARPARPSYESYR